MTRSSYSPCLRTERNGEVQPCWSADGKELVYYSEQKHRWKSAPIRPGPRFETGTPVDLFEVRSVWGADLSPDGRFLINTPDPSASLVPIDVIVNWAAGLAR